MALDGLGITKHGAHGDMTTLRFKDGYAYPHRICRYCMTRSMDTYLFYALSFEGHAIYNHNHTSHGSRFSRNRFTVN